MILPPLRGTEINPGSSRRAMGYPEAFVATELDCNPNVFQKVRTQSIEGLLDLISSTKTPFSERWAAGQLLGLLGDPRISPYSPPMIPLPGGRVRLGLDQKDLEATRIALESVGVLQEWIAKESPSYELNIRPFAIAKYPVTHLEYREFLLHCPDGEIPDSWRFGRFPAEYANHPVHTISAESATAYASWLARTTGRAFRLPSEAEWEYAASGPRRLEYPWGPHFEKQRANTVERGLLITTPVGLFPEGASPFGVHDLAGNVEEYVSDLYSPYPSEAGNSANPAPADDLANTLGSYRVARGGSFTRYHDLARCKRRHGRYPKDIYVMGFRLAETL